MIQQQLQIGMIFKNNNINDKIIFYRKLRQIVNGLIPKEKGSVKCMIPRDQKQWMSRREWKKNYQ